MNGNDKLLSAVNRRADLKQSKKYRERFTMESEDADYCSMSGM
jgi:hypothetical protein